MAMIRISSYAFRAIFPSLGLVLFTVAVPAYSQAQNPEPQAVPAQEQAPAVHAWRRVGEPPPGPSTPGQDPEPVARPDEPVPTQEGSVPPAAGTDLASEAPHANTAPANDPPPYGIPPQLTIKPGTFLTIRTNEALSSDRNHPGDPFSGVLMQPVVVDGVVVAQRGQTVFGRVVDAEKAHAHSPSRLGLQLTELTLADGTQIPVRSQLAGRQGGTAPASEQAGTVITTTALGAMIGSIAGWGTGALIGAGAGATAGGIAVMMTRNRPTVIYPETAVTFRMESPVTIPTANAPQAFRYVTASDYQRPAPAEARRLPVRRPLPPPYWGPALYPAYPGYPGYWGPYYGPGFGFGVIIGHGGHRYWH